MEEAATKSKGGTKKEEEEGDEVSKEGRKKNPASKVITLFS